MKKLKSKYEKSIREKLSYAVGELARISNITKFIPLTGGAPVFMKYPLVMHKYTTWEGIQEQINQFVNPVGLLFYVVFVQGKIVMEKMAVELEVQNGF